MRRLAIPVVAGAAVTAGGVLWAVADYRAWRALGPGGLPPTWRGWLRTTRWRLAKRDPLTLGPLAARRGDVGDIALLTDLPTRAGRRPRVAPHPVPHRQVSDRAPASIHAALNGLFEQTVRSDPGRLRFATSHFETNTRAVTLHPALQRHRDAQAACGEVAHLHASDGSMHMILSASDAYAVTEKGWGERHGLAGQALSLPLTYMMIYAPRDREEVAVVSSILHAAVAYQSLDPSGVGSRPIIRD